MHPIIENFSERPKNQQYAICAVIIIVVLGLCWQYLLKGQINEQAKLEDEIENLKLKKQAEIRIANNLPKFEQEVKKLDKKLELVLLELPDNKEIPDLLSSISALAQDTGLEVIKFAQRSEVMQDFYAMVPVDIELEGSFHQLLTFYDEVGHLARVVNIDNISIDIVTETNNEVLIRALGRATTFRYLAEDEQKKLNKQNNNQKKAGKRRAVKK